MWETMISQVPTYHEQLDMFEKIVGWLDDETLQEDAEHHDKGWRQIALDEIARRQANGE